MKTDILKVYEALDLLAGLDSKSITEHDVYEYSYGLQLLGNNMTEERTKLFSKYSSKGNRLFKRYKNSSYGPAKEKYNANREKAIELLHDNNWSCREPGNMLHVSPTRPKNQRKKDKRVSTQYLKNNQQDIFILLMALAVVWFLRGVPDIYTVNYVFLVIQFSVMLLSLMYLAPILVDLVFSALGGCGYPASTSLEMKTCYYRETQAFEGDSEVYAPKIDFVSELASELHLRKTGRRFVLKEKLQHVDCLSTFDDYLQAAHLEVQADLYNEEGLSGIGRTKYLVRANSLVRIFSRHKRLIYVFGVAITLLIMFSLNILTMRR